MTAAQDEPSFMNSRSSLPATLRLEFAAKFAEHEKED
jgi:hypothetical protein